MTLSAARYRYQVPPVDDPLVEGRVFQLLSTLSRIGVCLRYGTVQYPVSQHFVLALKKR